MERGPPPPRMRSPMGQVRGRPDFAEQARLDREKEDERVREERAKEELAVELAQLTSTASFQDVRRWGSGTWCSAAQSSICMSCTRGSNQHACELHTRAALRIV